MSHTAPKSKKRKKDKQPNASSTVQADLYQLDQLVAPAKKSKLKLKRHYAQAIPLAQAQAQAQAGGAMLAPAPVRGLGERQLTNLSASYALPPLDSSFTLDFGGPPKLVRETTQAYGTYAAPANSADSSSGSDSDSGSDSADSGGDAKMEHDDEEAAEASPPEGFVSLAKWEEKSFEQLKHAPMDTWLSYTRDPSTFVSAKAYQEAKEIAEKKNVDVQVVLQEKRGMIPGKRKKTVCKIVGVDHERNSLRGESIPISGARASAVFPNQTHSWDIPASWRGNPKYYLIRPEHHPHNKAKKNLKAAAGQSGFL